VIAAALLLLQAAMPGSTVAVRVQSLLGRTAIPAEGQVAVLTTASADTVFAGDQVEILTTAWFPSAIRDRLRRPPTLRPPTLSGVWSLSVITLPGVAASVTVGETVYDLFASHQVVFPVAAGRLVIPPAELGFSLPGGRQYFGDERRDERRSPPRTLVVRALPAAGRPAGFAGPVARDLRVAWRIASPNARLGELLTVDVLLGGEGNLSLWGAPEIEWPAGMRVYPDRVDEAAEWRGARLGGIRRFRFLLLPDSAGSVTLPSLRYPYFDPLSGTYRLATAAPVVVPILPSVAPAEHRDTPPLLLEVPAAWPRRLVDDWPVLLLAFGLLAPLLAPVGSWLRRRTAPARRPPPAQALSRFERLLDHLVGEATEREARELTVRLRRAGLARPDAEAGAVLHEQLRRLRFARPDARAGREEVLAQEVARWLERLPGALKRRVQRAPLAVLLVLAALPATAQAPSPDRLYRDGAWEASATAQRARLRASPTSRSAWYNYGAALWMSRRDGAAAAAWLEAYRLAPRNRTVRRAWDEAALGHTQLRGLEPAMPATPEELILAGLAVWIVAAGLLAAAPRRRRLAGGMAALAMLLAGGGLLVRGHYARPTAITLQEATLRVAPHGLAEVVGPVDGFAQVPIEMSEGGWVRIRDHAGRRGWLPAAAVARVRGLD